MRIILSILAIIGIAGCAGLHYQYTQPGELHGKMVVQWIDHDQFIFLPDVARPLTFTRFDGSRITPGRMYTDGGSIPRPLWVFRSYSPWGYAPAFIVHDWLFVVQHCKYPGYEDYDVEEAAKVMSEITKTLMLQDPDSYQDKLALYTMFESVKSPIAVQLWKNGKCESPPVRSDGTAPRTAVPLPVKEYVIEFP